MKKDCEIIIRPNSNHKLSIKNLKSNFEVYEAITIMEETKLYFLELLRKKSFLIENEKS